MLVVVRTLSGQTIPIEIEGSDTVRLLKREVLRELNILPKHQNLVYSGKSLHDARTLNYYHIPRESTIYMVLRLPGGDSRTRRSGTVNGPFFSDTQEIRDNHLE